MSFLSPSFLLFITATLLCYFISPRRFRWCVLLLSSYVFYWFTGGLFAISVLTFSILTIHFSALWACSLRGKNAKTYRRRAPLALCLTVNFGLLAFLKFSAQIDPSFGNLMVLGVSFYTFQAAGYLIDVYRGKAEPERILLKTALFLSFFPQLVQGPISRYGDIATDLFAGHGWEWDRARGGIQRIIWGYVMKLVIADYAVKIVDAVFSGYDKYGGAVILFAVMTYGVQVYADFAGGINIAAGIAEIVGVKLPDNFRQPFFAVSLADFWRRWHITLGTWLRDYLFYPLAISKPMGKLGKNTRRLFKGRAGIIIPSCLATFCVYIVVGIWHGSGTGLLAFGLLNGVLISAALLVEPQIEKLRAKTGIDGSKPKFGRVFSALRTFAVLEILRYFILAGSFQEALRMLKHTVLHPRLRELWNGKLLEIGLDSPGYLILATGVIILLARDFLTECGKDCGKMFNEARPAVQFILYLAAFASIAAFGIYSKNALSASFIYAGM